MLRVNIMVPNTDNPQNIRKKVAAYLKGVKPDAFISAYNDALKAAKVPLMTNEFPEDILVVMNLDEKTKKFTVAIKGIQTATYIRQLASSKSIKMSDIKKIAEYKNLPISCVLGSVKAIKYSVVNDCEVEQQEDLVVQKLDCMAGKDFKHQAAQKRRHLCEFMYACVSEKSVSNKDKISNSMALVKGKYFCKLYGCDKSVLAGRKVYVTNKKPEKLTCFAAFQPGSGTAVCDESGLTYLMKRNCALFDVPLYIVSTMFSLYNSKKTQLIFMSENKDVQEIIEKIKTLPLEAYLNLVDALCKTLGFNGLADYIKATSAQAGEGDNQAAETESEEDKTYVVKMVAFQEEKKNAIIKFLRTEFEEFKGSNLVEVAKKVLEVKEGGEMVIAINQTKQNADRMKSMLSEQGAEIKVQAE